MKQGISPIYRGFMGLASISSKFIATRLGETRMFGSDSDADKSIQGQRMLSFYVGFKQKERIKMLEKAKTMTSEEVQADTLDEYELQDLIGKRVVQENGKFVVKKGMRGTLGDMQDSLDSMPAGPMKDAFRQRIMTLQGKLGKVTPGKTTRADMNDIQNAFRGVSEFFEDMADRSVQRLQKNQAALLETDRQLDKLTGENRRDRSNANYVINTDDNDELGDMVGRDDRSGGTNLQDKIALKFTYQSAQGAGGDDDEVAKAPSLIPQTPAPVPNPPTRPKPKPPTRSTIPTPPGRPTQPTRSTIPRPPIEISKDDYSEAFQSMPMEPVAPPEPPEPKKMDFGDHSFDLKQRSIPQDDQEQRTPQGVQVFMVDAKGLTRAGGNIKTEFFKNLKGLDSKEKERAKKQREKLNREAETFIRSLPLALQRQLENSLGLGDDMLDNLDVFNFDEETDIEIKEKLTKVFTKISEKLFSKRTQGSGRVRMTSKDFTDSLNEALGTRQEDPFVKGMDLSEQDYHNNKVFFRDSKNGELLKLEVI